MSKPMKEMIVSDYQSRLGDAEEAIIVSLRGIGAEGTESIRGKMRAGSVSVAVVKNSLARKAFEGTALEALSHRERSAVLLRHEGYAQREIAEILGTTTGTIGTLTARALRKLAASDQLKGFRP